MKSYHIKIIKEGVQICECHSGGENYLDAFENAVSAGMIQMPDSDGGADALILSMENGIAIKIECGVILG